MWSLAKYLIRTNFILKRRQNFSIFLRESSFPHQSDKERFSSLTRARTSRAKEDRDDDGGAPSDQRERWSVSLVLAWNSSRRTRSKDSSLHRPFSALSLSVSRNASAKNAFPRALSRIRITELARLCLWDAQGNVNLRLKHIKASRRKSVHTFCY